MKKRIMTGCLILMFLGSIKCFAFYDIDESNVKNAVETLSEYSIINGYEDGTFRPDNTITRAEFAKVIVAAANLYCMIDEPVGYDDTEEHWAKEYIEIAKHMGIINGTSNTTFEPDEKLTNEQAVKMVVCMLGYGKEAQENGGYPNGYIMVGSQLGLMNTLKLSNEAYAKRGDVAVMIYNVLDVSYRIIDNSGNVVEDISDSLTLRGIHEALLQINSYEENIDEYDEDEVESVG